VALRIFVDFEISRIRAKGDGAMTNKNSEDKNALVVRDGAAKIGGATRLFGSLRDALLAAGREPPENDLPPPLNQARPIPPPLPPAPPAAHMERPRVEQAAQHVAHLPVVHASNIEKTVVMSEPPKDSAREARTPKAPSPAPSAARPEPVVGRVPVDSEELASQVPRTQPMARGQGSRPGGDARTQLLRGKQKVSRAKFHQDPVVGWLVIVGGPGLGAHRSIYEGNNTVGRASTQRVPIDFGDDTISSEEQAYIRYDSNDRSFLFVPNLAKTNVVQVNDQKPTGAVDLKAMDVISMGRTQLVFVPFCGADFDWAELSDVRE
jgi:hypothetical protein